jgi:hypothetical protein
MALTPDLFNPNYLGTDISQLSGDLATSLGDFKVQSGVSNVIDAFVRELTTPLGYIAKYVLDVDGLKIVDANYGNEAYYQLSEPLSEPFITSMISHIQNVAAMHQDRLTVNSIDYNIVDLKENKIQFLINFLVESDVTPVQLVLYRVGTQLTANLFNT